MLTEELKQCPFCGGEVSFREHKAGGGAACWSVIIQCKSCKAEMSAATGLYTTEDFKKKMIDRWNRRVFEIPINIGDMSDGYHTFNELYHHRAILFSVICNTYSARAWKSKKHSDGTMYDGMFIVGIQTNEGPATYHYDIEPYWDMFNVRELPNAPEWDGHTPDDAIRRIQSIT